MEPSESIYTKIQLRRADVETMLETEFNLKEYGETLKEEWQKIGEQKKTIDISGWQTNQLTNFQTSFSHCCQLEEIIGLEDLNMSKVTDISYLFDDCWKLKPINFNKWNMKHLTYTICTFEDSNLESIDISKWNTSYLSETRDMFGACNKFKKYTYQKVSR